MIAGKRILAAALLLLSLAAAGQEKPKTGWVMLPLPNLGYSTDTGVTLGVLGDVFNFGDGSVYPNYLQHIGIAVGYATKGSWSVHACFECPNIVDGLRLNATFTYRDAMVNNFYGFNGIASPYYPELDLNPGTRTAWYTNHRKHLRVNASLLGDIVGKLSWLGGVVFRKTDMSNFSLERYDSQYSLYQEYRKMNLIRADEYEGGMSLEFKAGLSYDSRDVERNPGKGIFAELYSLSNFDVEHGKYHYGQLVAHFRQYITIFPCRCIFAYHLGLQHQIWGEMPFYNLNEIATPFYPFDEFDGIGSRASVRGIRYNRISAAGYAWANVEFRVTPFIFDAFRQHFNIIFNPFVDLAAITRTYRLEEQMATLSADTLHPLYQDLKLPVMVAPGIGVKLVMNTNFMMSVDVGRALNPQISDWTIGMASTYVF